MIAATPPPRARYRVADRLKRATAESRFEVWRGAALRAHHERIAAASRNRELVKRIKQKEKEAMVVRAKFKVNSRTTVEYPGTHGKQVEVKLTAVTGGPDESEENKAFWEATFWEATPAGTLELSCLNQAVADQFVPGREFYLTFDEAPADAE